MLGRAWTAITAWSRRFWEDLKASTDASLLAMLRFVGLLYGRIDTRLPIDQAFQKSLNHRLSRHAGWRQAFGGITYLLFMVLVVTGVLLSFYYRPSAEEAYQSIQHIVSGVTMGWLMRDAHVWGGQPDRDRGAGAHGARVLRRVLQAAARDELAGGAAAAVRDLRVRRHRLPAALGSVGVLDGDGGVGRARPRAAGGRRAGGDSSAATRSCRAPR